MIYLKICSFVDTLQGILDGIGRLIETVVNYIVEIIRLIPILFGLLTSSITYAQLIMGFCAILSPFIIIYEIRLTIGIVRSFT